MIRSQTLADVNAAQAAVAGKSWKKTVSSNVKGQRYPFHYGIHPTGRYPDQPFIRELYYDTAATDLLLQRAEARADSRARATKVHSASAGHRHRQLLAVRSLALT